MAAPRKVEWSDPEVIKQIEMLAGLGNTEANIAEYFGVCPDTMTRNKKIYQGLSEAIKRGRRKAVAIVAGELYKQAKAGNTTAMIFFLKNRDPINWRDRQELEHSGKDGGPIEVKETRERLASRIDELTLRRRTKEAAK